MHGCLISASPRMPPPTSCSAATRSHSFLPCSSTSTCVNEAVDRSSAPVGSVAREGAGPSHPVSVGGCPLRARHEGGRMVGSRPLTAAGMARRASLGLGGGRRRQIAGRVLRVGGRAACRAASGGRERPIVGSLVSRTRRRATCLRSGEGLLWPYLRTRSWALSRSEWRPDGPRRCSTGGADRLPLAPPDPTYGRGAGGRRGRPGSRPCSARDRAEEDLAALDVTPADRNDERIGGVVLVLEATKTTRRARRRRCP
jgi:hypothetical protein